MCLSYAGKTRPRLNNNFISDVQQSLSTCDRSAFIWCIASYTCFHTTHNRSLLVLLYIYSFYQCYQSIFWCWYVFLYLLLYCYYVYMLLLHTMFISRIDTFIKLYEHKHFIFFNKIMSSYYFKIMTSHSESQTVKWFSSLLHSHTTYSPSRTPGIHPRC